MQPAVRACAFACFLLAACGRQEPLNDADKSLFLRVSDLAEFGVRYQDAQAGESFAKEKQSDGSYELTYKFEAPSGQRPLFIHGSVNIGRASSDAALAEAAAKVDLLVAFKSNGVEERAVPGIQAGKLTVLVKGEQAIGNVFTWRDGARSHLLVLSGLYVRDPAIWSKLMAPKIEQLSRYAPAAKKTD
jgi:hypothetical protein